MQIVIIDDDSIVSASLKTILQADPEFEVVGIGSSGAEAVHLYEEKRPDVLLMDIRMEGMDGLEAAAEILCQFPKALILFLTTFSDDEYIIKALNIGAKGYILKQDFESIVPALRTVISGQSVFGGEIVSKIPSILQSNGCRKHSAEEYGLNEREAEIIALVGAGKNNREIADGLFLSEGTVRNYISSILLKLELRDRTQLAMFYYKNLNGV